MCWHTEEVSARYLISGLDLWIVAAGDVVCLFFCTFSFVRAFFSFSFSLSLSFFSFFFLSTLKGRRDTSHDHRLRLTQLPQIKAFC